VVARPPAVQAKEEAVAQREARLEGGEADAARQQAKVEALYRQLRSEAAQLGQQVGLGLDLMRGCVLGGITAHGGGGSRGRGGDLGGGRGLSLAARCAACQTPAGIASTAPPHSPTAPPPPLRSGGGF
jgi:hypothetical protein